MSPNERTVLRALCDLEKREEAAVGTSILIEAGKTRSLTLSEVWRTLTELRRLGLVKDEPGPYAFLTKEGRGLARKEGLT